MVKDAYLTTGNKAPVDSIRTMVSNDGELRDAVLQLNYNRTDDISADLKNKLYLAGIINLDSTGVRFKNPIIKESLPVEWLMRQGNKNQDFDAALDRAEMLIRINKDYNGALVVLDTLFKTIGEGSNDRLNYLEGECNYKLFRNKASQTYLERVSKESAYYVNALLLNGMNHKELRQYQESLNCYEEALKLNPKENLTFKLKMAYAETCIEVGDAEALRNAESTLAQLQQRETNDYHQMAVILYYCSIIRERQNNRSEAVSYVESALVYAQENEHPKLLYRMLTNTTDEERKADVLQQLIDSMKRLRRPQASVDFDNVLAYSQYDAMVIFAEVILNYPTYLSEVEPLMKQFYNKKEDLYCVICATLDQNREPQTLGMARHIMKLYRNQEFELLDFQVVDIFNIWARNYETMDELEKIGGELYQYLRRLKNEVGIPPELIRPLILPLTKKAVAMDILYIRGVVTVAEKWFRTVPKMAAYEEHFIMVSFYTSIVAFAEKNYNWFIEAGSMYLQRIEAFIAKLQPEEKLDINLEGLRRTMAMVMSMGVEINRIRMTLMGYIMPQAERNSQVVVYDHIHKREVRGKYKTMEKEIKSGFFEIREVVS